MAGKNRTASSAVALFQALQEKPYAFGFFQAVRRLENVFRDKPRIGCSLHPHEDPVRFGQAPSLLFAPAVIESFKPGEAGSPARMSVYFLGLLGPQGPMPLHLTEYVKDRIRDFGDHTTVQFFDLFHHRMLSLFYRAWANPRPAVQFDRPERDRFSAYVGSVFGLGLASQRNRDAAPDLAKLHFAGLLAGQTRHPEGLEAILRGYFQVKVSLREFVGAWMEIPAGDRWHLGRDRSLALGLSLTLGARVWGRHQKFRIVFGPLSYVDYQRLLPGGDSLKKLLPLVRAYTGDQLNWDVNMILKKEEVPRLLLGKTGRLGWTTWLTPRRSDEDACDLKLNPLGSYA